MTSKATKWDLLEQPYKWRSVTRDGVRTLQTRCSDEVCGSYESFTIERLQERVNESGVEDYSLSIETYHDYGDERARLVIEGWRAPEQHEVDTALKLIDDMRAHRARAEEAQIEKLKKTRPELFK